jgi:hypothetical protein
MMRHRGNRCLSSKCRKNGLRLVKKLWSRPPVQINAAVLMNAIDGSEIDLYNEM